MSNTEWKEYEMSELIEEISMGPFGSNIKVECFTDSGIPVLNGSNLVGFRLNEASFNYVTEEKATSLGRANAYRGDIVITHRGTLGQIVFIPQNSKFERYVISQSQFRIRCNEKVLPEYLVYYFHSREGQYKLLSNASQVGVPSLARPTTTFQKLKVTIPSVAEQERIVKILGSLDDKIELNDAISKNLEEQAQAIFRNWFIDFAPFGGKMPEGWKVGKLSDLGTVVGGGTPSKAKKEYYTENGIAWITPKDLSLRPNKFTSKGEIDITQEGYGNSSAKLMPKGSVLFSSRAPIGYISIAKNEVCTNQGFKSVVPKQNIGTPYVYFYLKMHIDEIENKASGSTFKEASGALMNSLDAIIPSDEVLNTFNALCNPIFEQQENLEKENQRLTTLRDTLLPKLMSGEQLEKRESEEQ